MAELYVYFGALTVALMAEAARALIWGLVLYAFARRFKA